MIMTYILGTTHRTVQWYVFDPDNLKPGEYELIDKLDLNRVPLAGNKETAKNWALQLGLQTWIYFKH
jgi:hypothetical protein